MKAVGDLLPDLPVGTPRGTCRRRLWAMVVLILAPHYSFNRLWLVQINAHSSPTPAGRDAGIAEAARVLDLSERGFHDRFTSGVEGSAPQGGQEARHALLDVRPAGGRPRGATGPGSLCVRRPVAISGSIPRACRATTLASDQLSPRPPARPAAAGAAHAPGPGRSAATARHPDSPRSHACATITWAVASTATWAL